MREYREGGKYLSYTDAADRVIILRELERMEKEGCFSRPSLLARLWRYAVRFFEAL